MPQLTETNYGETSALQQLTEPTPRGTAVKLSLPLPQGCLVCPPYGIGGKLNVVKQGGVFCPRRTPLSRSASLPPYCAGGIMPNLIPVLSQLNDSDPQGGFDHAATD